MKFYHLLCLASLLATASCQQNDSPGNQAPVLDKTPATIETTTLNILGTYEGTLPCADCEGIRMELTLEDNPASHSQTYRLQETYLGVDNNNNTFESTGSWSVVRGTEQDSSATVYQLIPDQTAEPRYFLRVSDTEIKMLDMHQREIESELNYSLQKQL